MPTYQYQCMACGHELEEFQSMSEAPLTTCPSCKGETLKRILGSGAGLIFKGSGFYLTDYKKPSEHARTGESGGKQTTKKQKENTPPSPDGGRPAGGGSNPASGGSGTGTPKKDS